VEKNPRFGRGCVLTMPRVAHGEPKGRFAGTGQRSEARCGGGRKHPTNHGEREGGRGSKGRPACASAPVHLRCPLRFAIAPSLAEPQGGAFTADELARIHAMAIWNFGNPAVADETARVASNAKALQGITYPDGLRVLTFLSTHSIAAIPNWLQQRTTQLQNVQHHEIVVLHGDAPPPTVRVDRSRDQDYSQRKYRTATNAKTHA
jgi:hypothetical protein